MILSVALNPRRPAIEPRRTMFDDVGRGVGSREPVGCFAHEYETSWRRDELCNGLSETIYVEGFCIEASRGAGLFEGTRVC